MSNVAEPDAGQAIKVESTPRTAIHSMTGFAKIAGEVTDHEDGTLATWTLSIKSVNHRFLDLHLRLPSGMDTLEMQLRRLLKERVKRGHLEITLSWEQSSAPEVIGYDKELVARYLAAFRDAQQEYELKQEPDLNAILRLPGVFKAGSTANGSTRRDEVNERLEKIVIDRLDEILGALNQMRQTEGAGLTAALTASLDRLQQDVKSASELRARVQPAHYERLLARLGALLSDAGEGAIDKGRLLQEAALLADRSDVEEELARLRVHIEHFRSVLRDGGEVGKKLDFLLQEMNREANTLLSKSAGIADEGSRLTVLGLGMKSEIEKAREQVQNLE